MGCTSGTHPVAELYIYATKNNLFRTSEPEVIEETKIKRRRK
jgi:hypothetical protein